MSETNVKTVKKVEKDKENYIKYMLTQDDTVLECFYNKEPFTLKTLETLLSHTYDTAIYENGISWNEFNEKSHPTISSEDKSYLVKRIDSKGSKIIFVSKYYGYNEWYSHDIIEWAKIDHLY